MRALVPVVAAGCLLSIGLGCARNEPAPSSVSTADAGGARQKVVLQSDWFPQAEHGGFYQALARGFYAEAGLAVEIWPGGPGAGIKLKVLKGEADFGMNRSDDLLLAVSQGMPFMIVAATFQHDPLGLMVHETSPVRTFDDLAGRVVIGNVSMAYFPFLERKFGITFEKRQNTYGIGEFLANPLVVQQCVVTNEPFFAAQHGRKVRTLLLADAGYDCYHAIFCRRELTRTAPDKVRAFVQASVRGWRDYLANDPAPAHKLILERNAQITAEQLTFSRGEMLRLRLVTGDRSKGEDVGRVSLQRLEEQKVTLVELKILQAPVAIDAVATQDFLPAPR